MPSGYYRFPTIQSDTIVFVCEDDLWTVPATGGTARRLTSGLGEATRPFLALDGKSLAFIGREEGQAEIYVMPSEGGKARRLTFLGGTLCQTAGWTQDGKIIFANNARQPFASLLYLYTVDTEGNPPQVLNIGPARAITYGPGGSVAIGRNTGDPARWKRYRGGTAGQLWIDEKGEGTFRPLIQLKGNLACPMWIGERVYFLSDHEGIGNLYSCLPNGNDLRRHTEHPNFYARNASTDGKRIAYHAGADLYLYDPVEERSNLVEVEFHSPQTQRNRKFVEAAKYLESWNLHPKGQAIAIASRGKAFTLANWEGAVIQLGESEDANGNSIRCRLPEWLNDGKRLIAVTDTGGEEHFVLLHADGSQPPEQFPDLDIGRPEEIAVNPQKDQLVFSNDRFEVLFLDLATHELRRIDKGKANPVAGLAWSPDGEWMAYSISISLQTMALKLWKASSGEIFTLTHPVLRDVAPNFDPDGKYLYFLSFRYFDPVYDNMQFDLNFPRGIKPCLITLQKDAPSPFIPLPKTQAEVEKDKEEKTEEAATDEKSQETGEAKKDEKKIKPVQIDVEGIEQRVIAFPVDEGRYFRVIGLKGGKVLYGYMPVEGALNMQFLSREPSTKGTLYLYNFEEQKEEDLFSGITDFNLSRDYSTLIYRSGYRLRVLKAGEKPDPQSNGDINRKGGWLDLGRIKVPVIPSAEWRQMYREAWRLQRDHFWTSDMSKVDWAAVYNHYLPLVDRVSSRSEFSDLVWEMQGELGTSHAYEFGGDYRPEPNYSQGSLGAEFVYDEAREGWRITYIVRGDSWEPKSDSPLHSPGVNVKVGDVLTTVNGRRLNRTLSPEQTLVNLAKTEVALVFAPDGKEPPRTVTVRTISNEFPARYREWVEHNRQHVHESTQGRVGYVHIPDMGPHGYAEFHRAYLAEVDREGLIVDVRFNGGGHVSARILEKLARRRLGYDTSRWSEFPSPYPPESVLGPMVALTNEHAGSDGDIFSHGFKLMHLGPLLGMRTWGGVIGIWPRHSLIDGTITTQPEFSFWFIDVGWGVENYGTDPDIEIDNTPQDYTQGVDAQLERSIAEIQRLLEANPPRQPNFDGKPNLSLPKLT